MSSTDHEFKNLTLRDIRIYREKIQHFLDTTYSIAENAVQNLFTNVSHPDVLRNLDEMNTVLKECREKLVTVANAIPNEPSGLPPVNQNCEATGAIFDFTVPKRSIVFDKPYLVEMLSSGSPSRFWLKLESTTTENIEEKLCIAFRDCPGLRTIPCPGTFIVCLHSGKYCRGKVIATAEFNTSKPTLEIMLVDYGETITATVNQLYPIQRAFCLEPAHGLLCAVHNLEPVEETWKLDAIVFFNQSCESIKAIFHRPPNDHDDTGAFSNYLPDYYVSLQNRNGKEIIDIGLAMIKGRMGRPFQHRHPLAHSISSELVNNEPPRIQESLKENQPSEKVRKVNLSKTNLTPESDGETPGSHLAQANRSASKASSSPSILENISPKSTLLESQTSELTKLLNVDAKEFVFGNHNFVANQQKHTKKISTRHLCQNESALTSKQTSSAGSANLELSCPTNQETKIRAIPLNNILSTKNSSCATLVNDMADDIDELILVPSANRALPLQSHHSVHNSLDLIPSVSSFRKPADRSLMAQFLDCVHFSTPFTRQPYIENSESDTQSFATASSQIHLPDDSKATRDIFNTEQGFQINPISLDYQYESVLKPRTSPVLANSNVNTLHCCFSHVISPSHFYVHLLDEISTLVKPLSKRLNELYENSQQVHVTHPEVGSFWVVQEEQTKFWSRAKILSVETNDEIGWKTPGEVKHRTICTVFLVDWGNVEVVPICNLRPLVKEILDIPCLALRCRLDGIYPFEKSKNSGEWSSNATDKFTELAGIDQELTALFSSRNLDRDGALPLLMLKDGDDGKYSVNEQLVLLGFAFSDVFNEAASQSITDDGETEWGDPMHDDYFSPMNTPALNTENYDSVTTGHIPKDEQKICRFFAAKGSCYKGIRCDHLHSNPRKNAFTEDTIEVCVHVPCMNLVSGSLVHVQVTWVINAFRFYAILPHGTRNLELAFADDDENETLETLQKALQEEYTTNYFLHRISIAPSAGDIVIARSPEDNHWYRGRVMEEGENDHFGIYFLDFGNGQLVHMRNICNPLPRFVHLPTQAVEMFLNGIETSAEANTIEAKNVLVSLVKNKDLVARIVHTVPFVCVDLYNTSGPCEIDIASEMIRLQVARKAKRKPYCRQQRGKEFAG